jgi:hypothetical protein
MPKKTDIRIADSPAKYQRPYQPNRKFVSLTGRYVLNADYECMDGCFGLRPIPVGSTRTEKFCAKCKAERCGMKPELSTVERYVLGMVRLRKSRFLKKQFRHLVPWAREQLEETT